MTEHSFGCLSDQEAIGLHDLSKAQVYQKPKEMTEYEKQVEISFCEKYLKYLRKPHFSWDILLRPLRIYYYSRKLKKLKETDKE